MSELAFKSVVDLIAIRAQEPIEAIAAKVSEALGVLLKPRDSYHWGSYYSGWPESPVKLTANLDPVFQEGDPPEERWFSSTAREAGYLVWDTDDPHATAGSLRAAGLDAEIAEQT